MFLFLSFIVIRTLLHCCSQIDRRGEIVSENTYRLNMARKEHKKHVRELLAQAIVHKTLDMERNRQVEIRKKLEEIAKCELVRRVRVSIVCIMTRTLNFWHVVYVIGHMQPKL